MRGSVVGGSPLYARYNGGLELHDGSGHLPRDADGFYVSRTTGERLLVDGGWAEGDAIGAPKVYGLLTAVVVGAPATARRSGFDLFSDANYVVLALDNTPTLSVITTARAPTTAGRVLMQAGLALADRFTLNSESVNGYTSVTCGDGADPNLNSTTNWRNTQLHVAGTMTAAGDVTLRIWNSGGTLLEDLSLAGNPQTPSTDTYIGRLPSLSGYSWSGGDCDVIMGWDGTVLPPATEDAIVAALVAGATVDDICATYSPDLCTDGIVCGAYDPTAATTLFTLSGTGASVTAEYP